MISFIELPGLRGDEASSFLAALGVLVLVDRVLGDDSRLAWPAGPRNGAVLWRASGGDLDSLAEGLAGVARRMVDDEELLPGAGPGFPPRKEGKESDPTRSMPFSQGVEWSRHARGLPLEQRAWLPSVFATNAATGPEQKRSGCLVRNPIFDAGPGTVSASRTLSNARDASQDPERMVAALTSARRIAGSIGGYLDWRADRDTALASSERDTTTSYGDPIRTWLGLTSIYLTDVVCRGGQAVTALTPGSTGDLYKPLVWPVWTSALGPTAVRTLLAHPDVAAVQPGPRSRAASAPTRPRTTGRLSSLSVAAVFAAARLRRGNNDGAYGPARRIWPSDGR